MKTIMLSAVAVFFTLSSFVQQPDPWKKEQVMPTKELAEKIQSNSKDLPVIFNVGPMENIKTAIKIGNTDADEGIKKLISTVSAMKKSSKIVVYCGCCSYANCPNIRPAFKKLQELGFKNVKVLDIPEGLKPDWVAKEYPVEKTK
jgi:hypothetical protein